MAHILISNQKFDSIRIPVIREITKSEKNKNRLNYFNDISRVATRPGKMENLKMS